ncbi:hypothetical protein TanjilG_07170 [Lupinus angustifolius]|uniref:UDP-glycosyltransferases domain-containing protein n=1 Tax=Lupinus angustifolius TaxID=3871 RepID=A0A1J7FP48_LUPAN|nr:hypothetical protein TanjilG_07170 [Lupinus angustifolius]
MGAETTAHSPIHILFFPFMGHGHMIPMVDMAKLFASKGVKTTILTTPLNAPFIFKTIEKSKTYSNINMQTIKFHSIEAGLPNGCEIFDSIPSPEFIPLFFKGTELLQEGFEQQLSLQRPNSIVSDTFFTRTNDSSAKFNIPRIVFYGASGQPFIWVVKKSKKDGEEWLPGGFEKRIEGKGLIIRGWAPQVSILEHEAIGAFMTHCGWNSTLEGVVAGVPFITWPVSAEQFYNERLVVDVLKTGVPVGVKRWCLFGDMDDSIKWDTIEKTVRNILGKDEAAEEMRKKAKELSRLARKTVEEGGSSDLDLDAFIVEFDSLRG